MAKRTRGNEPPKVTCSVCGKSQHEARRMLQATNTVILQTRRLSKDYERLPATGEALIYIPMSRIMLRRLARS